jgi:HEAT repeat protein
MIDGITLPDAINGLSDPNPDTRYHAAWVLQYIGDASAVSSLLTAMGDVDANVRMGAAQALGRIGDVSALNALLKMLNHVVTGERYMAAVALGRLKDTSAIDPLRIAMRDDDVFVRCAAAYSLSEICGFTIAPKVFEALNRSEVNLREASARQVEKQIKVDDK